MEAKMKIKKLKFDYKSILVNFKEFNIEWLILGIVAIIIFSSHMYNDFWETMRHSLKVWDALFDGKILDFYAYCGGNNGGIYCGSDLIGSYMDARYDFTIYLIFAIWNLPLWIIEHFSDINIQNYFLAMIYAKSMLLVAIAITARLITVLIKDVTKNDERTPGIILSYLSSCVFLASILTIGQYDVLSLIFILLGTHFYLKDNYKGFIISFIIANSMKYFALMYMLPLMCLKQKNIFKLAGNAILSMSLSFFFKFLFSLGTYGSAVLASNDGLIGILFEYQVYKNVSLYLVSYLALVLFCYNSKADCSYSKHCKDVIWTGFTTFILLYVATPAYPYWVVLCIPFLTLLIHTSDKNYSINTLLALLFEVSLLIKHFTWYSWCYSSKTYGNMLLYKLIPNKAAWNPGIGAYIINWMDSLPTWNIPVLLVTVFTAVGYALIFFNRPKENNAVALNYTYKKSVIRLRLCVGLLIAAIPDIYYIGVAYGIFAKM